MKVSVAFFSWVAMTCVASMAAGATPEQVDASVAQGVAWLYGQEHNGNWERYATAAAVSPEPNVEAKQSVGSGQWGGLTALAVDTLLSAGENPADPRLASAIDFLKHAELQGNYAVSLRAQIWQYLDYEHSPEIKRYINRDFETLLESVQRTGDASGMYQYYVRPYIQENWYDHSNSQIAVLGVWALAETNVVEVPDEYWRLVDQGWKHAQKADGAWNYHVPDLGWPESDAHSEAMTSAAVATLYITQDYLRVDTGCTGNVDNANIEAGIKWLGANFNEAFRTKKWSADWLPEIKYYGLYGMERVGQASGRKYLGQTLNWFSLGADQLIKEQAAGGWVEVPSTCLALLFLTHGRAPVMFNKLEYNIDMHGDQTKESNWNQRPADARRLARWMGKSTELEFNWQVVNLSVSVDDLHDAPILYLAGDQILDFTKDEQAKLKQFVEEGGLIVFNADCGSSRFSKSVIDLGTHLFPGTEFRELPADHAIYTDEQFKRKLWKDKPSVLGLSNGSRELMILFPHDDPARFWQSGAYGWREDRHDVAGDIFEYIAGNINKLKKGRTFVVRPGPGGGGPAIRVARLQYSGNWDPEPGGWRHLAAIMHNAGQAEVTTEVVNLGDGKLTGYKVAHLTGTYAYKLTDAARAELKQFVEGGGTLIIDSCGGRAEFTASMEAELTAIFGLPGAPPVLAAGDAVYAAGPKIDKFEYRRMSRAVVGKLNEPRLRGAKINGRTAVFVSPEDLSTGRVGVPCDGVYGYDPNTASAIMADILLYAGK